MNTAGMESAEKHAAPIQAANCALLASLLLTEEQ